MPTTHKLARKSQYVFLCEDFPAEGDGSVFVCDNEGGRNSSVTPPDSHPSYSTAPVLPSPIIQSPEENLIFHKPPPLPLRTIVMKRIRRRAASVAEEEAEPRISDGGETIPPYVSGSCSRSHSLWIRRERRGAGRWRRDGPPPRPQPPRQRGVRSSWPDTRRRQRQTSRTTSWYPSRKKFGADKNIGDGGRVNGGRGGGRDIAYKRKKLTRFLIHRKLTPSEADMEAKKAVRNRGRVRGGGLGHPPLLKGWVGQVEASWEASGERSSIQGWRSHGGSGIPREEGGVRQGKEGDHLYIKEPNLN